MPFGPANAPATFQRAVDILLSGIQWKYCLVYQEDVIIYSKSEEDLIIEVDKVLRSLHSAGVSLIFQKSEFVRPSVKHMGHKISLGRLEWAMKRRAALEEFSFPKL